MKTLDNGIISIAIKEHGAELASIKHNGREYLWQADKEFWGRHSPVLFPIVGSVWNKEFRSGGKSFTMGQHGFARDMDFTLVSESANEIWFRLESNENTLANYPYEFVLEIGYRIEGKSIDVLWRVTNPSNEKIWFQIGAHPAFHWPLLSDGAIQEGTQAMKNELAASNERGYFKIGKTNAAATSLKKSVIGEGGCFDPALSCDEHLENGEYITLNTATFDHDALVYEHSQVNSVTLCTQDRTPYLTLTFDAPLVGLWSPVGKNAPFVCIEPWYGRADECGYKGEYEDKVWVNCLKAGGVFNGKYTISVE